MSDKDVELEITADDILAVAEIGDFPRETGGNEVFLSEGATQEVEKKVFSLLPKAVARKLEGIVPDSFELSEIEMFVTIKGSPLSVGVDGRVKVKFTRSA